VRGLIGMDTQQLGRILIVVGVLIVLVGGAFVLWGRIPLLGRLPGDINIQRGNVRIFVPITTTIILSIVLTIILNLVARFFR
jgi:hypothetical protein